MSRRAFAVLVGGGAALALVIGVLAVQLRGDDGRDETTVPHSSTTAPTRVSGRPGAPGVGDPYFPGLGNGGYDVAHYDLELTWAADDGSLEGVTRIEATATHDLSRFNLDLAGLEVRSVTVEGEEAAFTREGLELVVTPPAAIAEGRHFTTVVSYGGRPQPVSDGTELFEVGWHTDGREAYVVAEPTGASTFFPANDHPSDKATYTFRVTTPADQVVAANGLLVEDEPAGSGQRTWTYEVGDLMATYLVQVAIGDYVFEDAGTAGDVVLRHAFHRSLADAARATTSRTAEMMDMLDDVFGPYPFEAYGVLAIDVPLGFALETQTLTIIGADLADDGRGADQLLLHELAHQWVGNAVSPATWDDIWLNEGFATYAEWLWLERTGGPPAAETARVLAGSASANLDLPPGAPGSAELFSRTVYWRGGMTLQALREEIGDDHFFTILRRWVSDHDDDVASTADLVALAEEVSGQQLDDLFDRWLHADRLPSLDGA